jgi:Ca2+-transporting ATPase
MKKELEIGNITGLSESEAAAKLASGGYNELPSSQNRSFFAIAYDVAKEPMFLLLLGGGAVYLLLGDVREALMLLGFVIVVIGITLYQERKTERALEALRDLSSPRASVIRDGEQKRIAGRDVVLDDIMILSEGDRVPADALLISSVNLSVDESLLTGESVPVRKSADMYASDIPRPGGDDLPAVYSGTLLVQGMGIARVKATGIHTELGKIGKALQTIEQEETLLQKETKKLVRRLALLGLAMFALMVIAFGLMRNDWLQGLLAGITLAMAMLPEEFPVVLTIFLALGAWRISRNRVLTRSVPAVETLGSASVLCVDKTGTLTMNQMSVRKIIAGGIIFDPAAQADHLPEAYHEVIEFSILASQLNPFDPMEKAFRSFGIEKLSNTEHIHDNWTLVQEYPLSTELLAMSRVWKSPDSKDFVIAAKGAPEAIADICHFDEEEKTRLSAQIDAMAKEGLRIIGVAKSEFKKADLPGEQHDFKFEYIGLIGLADPVRPGVAEAVKDCHTAGIRVVMITGDYPVTARNIADQIGLRHLDGIMTGSELDAMSDDELKRRIGSVNIFARVVPEQKLRIVNALKDNGEIVAMTGDGVNDAAALKSAHIGIAMGGRGTDVAREAAALVLLDDDFSSIVRAIRMGRRIYDNLKKAMAYIFAIHVPIAGMSFLPLFFNWPLVLLPVHIVFLELIIDPACSIVFEAEKSEGDVMNRPPRRLDAPLFDRITIVLSILQGFSVLIVTASVFMIAIQSGLGEDEARTLCFTTLILANIGLILTNRSWQTRIWVNITKPNPALWWVIGGALLFLAFVLYLPVTQGIFHFSQLNIADVAICLGAAVLSILWFEFIKPVKAKVDSLANATHQR